MKLKGKKFNKSAKNKIKKQKRIGMKSQTYKKLQLKD